MPTASKVLDRVLVLEMVRVTEAAAIGASTLIGRGDEKAADAAAVEAMRDARDGGAIAELTRLAAAGAGVLIVAADVSRRRSMLSAALHPERFELSGALLFSRLCSEAAITERSQRLHEGSWIALIDHDTLTAHPELAEHFVDAVLLDPPRGAWLAPAGPNWVRVDGAAEQRFAASAYGASV